VANNSLEVHGVEEVVLVASNELEDDIADGFKELVLVDNNSLEVHGVEEAVAKNKTTGEEVGRGVEEAVLDVNGAAALAYSFAFKSTIDVEEAVLDANGAAALAYSFAFKSPIDACFTEALSDWATELDLACSFIFVSERGVSEY
jgi:microcompartment protein CcmK/EutM